MSRKEQGVQIQEKVKVGGALVPALPFNTIDEVYVDVNRNVMLREKIAEIDSTLTTIKSDNEADVEMVNRIESTVSDIQTSVGDGGNLSQEIEDIQSSLDIVKEKLEETTQKVTNTTTGVTELKTLINDHNNELINGPNGAHGIKYENGMLMYNDNGIWKEIKTGGTDLELIKHALSGKISLNQFIIRRINSNVKGGCFKDGFYFLNDVSPEYKTITVQIDNNNNNPETSVTYLGDIGDLTAGSEAWDDFFGHYPCLFKDGREVGRLQRNDFTKFLDGTSADITSGNAGDVMIAFPRLGLKISTEGNIISISITNNPNDSNFKYYAHSRGDTLKTKFYIGVYDGFILDGKLRSLSGKMPSTNITITESRDNAHANGSGYEQFLFYQLIYLQALYVLKYKNLNSQNAIGQGYTASNNVNFINTGGTDTKGMDWGEQNGTNHMKLFGIEGLWGNIWNWVDGVITRNVDGTQSIKTTTDNFDQYDNYPNVYDCPFSGSFSGWIRHVSGNTETGFLPHASGGTNSTFFTDMTIMSNNSIAFYGGTKHHNTESGIFNLRINASGHANQRGDLFGARLMYL